MRWLILAAVLLPSVYGDELIRLPLLPDSTDPDPPKPVQITELREDQIYVIEADVKCIVLASREGYVHVG